MVFGFVAGVINDLGRGFFFCCVYIFDARLEMVRDIFSHVLNSPLDLSLWNLFLYIPNWQLR